MHQQTRYPSRTSTPAAAGRQTSSRPSSYIANQASSRPGSSQDQSGPTRTSMEYAIPNIIASRESVKKLDQIIQNLHCKAATILLLSRVRVKPQFSKSDRGRVEEKRNKWFQADTPEILDFREDLQIWKGCGGFENRPPPLILETYLDASRVTKGHSLVAIDDNGRKCDVGDALGNFESSPNATGSTGRQRRSEVLLERWRIELKASSLSDADDFGPSLPTIYKKSIVLMRSLFTMARLSPAQKLAHQSLGKMARSGLEVRCRISTRETEYNGFDPIRHPLCNEVGDVATDNVMGDLELPVGRLVASVTWRNNCTFGIVDSDSLLSSQLAMTDFEFEPSVNQRDVRTTHGASEAGSLPHRTARGREEMIQPIASVGTFHGYVPTGTSPISTVRNYKRPGSDSSSSPPESISSRTPRDVPNSMPITTPTTTGRPTPRYTHERRPSIFKAGSLSGSSPLARNVESDLPSSPHSTVRPTGPSTLTHGRKPSSLTQGMPASLRGGPQIAAEPGMSSSPKPTGSSRFSSSFSGVAQHRRSRPSFGGTSRTADDDQGSSGKQSLSSSVLQPGSGLIAEAGTSSGSLQQDQVDIGEFIKALESKKTLQSFTSPKKGESSATGRKTTVQLSKFQHMKETNMQLTESMTSSMHLSRGLTSNPGMVPASISTASSPGKPISPHTPHTPAIPSRLSENSIIDYSTTVPQRPRPAGVAIPETSSEGTIAIDIPLSPRLPHGGRPSSVAVRDRDIAGDINDDSAAFAVGRRSMSAGNEEGDPPTLSTLLRRTQAENAEQPEAPSRVRSGATPADRTRQVSRSIENEEKAPSSVFAYGLSSSPRRRYSGLTRGPTPPLTGTSGSLGGTGGRYSNSSSHARPAATPDGVSDEPLLFEISEINQSTQRNMQGPRVHPGTGEDDSGARFGRPPSSDWHP